MIILLFSTSISLHPMLSTLRQSGVINAVPPDRGKLVGWHSSLVAISGAVCWWRETDDEVFMTRSINVIYEDNRTALGLIVRSDKSAGEVTNNRRLRSRYCTFKANYWQTWSIAQPLYNSKATCLCRPRCSYVSRKKDLRPWGNNDVRWAPS